MPRPNRLITIITIVVSSLLLLQNCGDIQKIRPYINIVHTVEALVAATDDTTSENGTIGFVLKISENGSITNSFRLSETVASCTAAVCDPASSLTEPYLAHTADRKTHFLYNSYADDIYNQNLGSVSKTSYSSQPYLNVHYGELTHTENGGTMAYNSGSPQVLVSGKGARGSLTTTSIYPWAITTLDMDSNHNDKRLQVLARLFPTATSWTLGYTANVGDTGPVRPFNEKAVHFAYKSTDNDSCNYVRVGVTAAGTGLETLVGPISVSVSGAQGGTTAIADQAITSCDVAMGGDGTIIVILKGCQSDAANGSTYNCSAERRVTMIEESTLSADATTLGTVRLIAAGTSDDDNFNFIGVQRDTTNSKWMYALERDDNKTASALGEDIVTKSGTGTTNEAALTFALSSDNGTGTVFDFIPIDANRLLVSYLNDSLISGALFSGLLQTDATITIAHDFYTLEDYSSVSKTILKSKMGYMDKKLFTLSILNTGALNYNVWDTFQGVKLYTSSDILDNSTSLDNSENVKPALVVTRTVDLTPPY